METQNSKKVLHATLVISRKIIPGTEEIEPVKTLTILTSTIIRLLHKCYPDKFDVWNLSDWVNRRTGKTEAVFSQVSSTFNLNIVMNETDLNC